MMPHLVPGPSRVQPNVGLSEAHETHHIQPPELWPLPGLLWPGNYANTIQRLQQQAHCVEISKAAHAILDYRL